MTVQLINAEQLDSLNKAHILWDNAFANANASNSFSGSNPAGALNPQTWERVRPTGSVTGTILQVNRSSTPVNCIAFAHNNLAGKQVRVDAAGAFSETFTVLSQAPVMIILPTTNIGTISVQVLTTTANPEIAYFAAGESLVMQRPIYGGHTPITLSRNTDNRPNMSQGGEWLGRSLYRRGVSTRYAWSNLTADWYRDNFDPFVEHCATGGGTFFIAWRPGDYPDETAYCWADGDIAPSNQGVKNLMDVSFNAIGYVGV